jgi:3-deoxy-D-manno-octulosonate 8-phosphate phosphatase (KDO 8-P phosphatase)
MIEAKLREIKLIAFDVDGTLTDGTISVDDNGLERKAFHIGDGLGVRIALTAGLKIYLVSGRRSEATRHRFVMLAPENLLLGINDKATALSAILKREGIAPSQAAFMGDDLNDLPAFGVVGVRVAPANAVEAVKRQADFVTTASGGYGAARELIDLILVTQGRYDKAVTEYFASLENPSQSILV